MAPRTVLREYGESSVAYELRRFGPLWESMYPGGILEIRLADSLADPIYGASFAIGFIEGFMDGGGRRLRAWRDDLDSTMKGLLRFIRDDGALILPVGIDVSLYEFFGRKFDPENPGTLSPEVERALEKLKIIHDMQPIFLMLGLLNEKFKAQSLLESLNLLADDIAASLVATGGGWIQSFLLATGDADRQGQMLGVFIGEAFVELIRAFVEPPELSMLELAALFDLQNDEVRALTPAKTP